MKISIIIAAAGSGKRMQEEKNKILLQLGDKPVLAWSLEIFSKTAAVKEIIIAARSSEIEEITSIAAAYPKVKTIVAGGETRADSVCAGLAKVDSICTHIGVHDAARPLLDMRDWQELINTAANEKGGAILAAPPKDSIKQHDGKYLTNALNREQILLAQTPQIFPANLLKKAYLLNENILTSATDDAQLVSYLGAKVRFVLAQKENLKITYPEDIIQAESTLRKRQKINWGNEDSIFPIDWPSLPSISQADLIQKKAYNLNITNADSISIGLGWDIHRMETNRALILGGVNIPYHLGLFGHSDADVLLHAIIDSLLGATNLGDIGRLFPDNDIAFKDISSIKLLKRTHSLLLDNNWQINNIDATIIAQKPKLAPYIENIQKNIAQALNLDPQHISIKAKTAESLGEIGKENAIAAFSLATVRG